MYYNGTLAANAYLNSRTYSLQNGGVLTCPTCTVLATQTSSLAPTVDVYPNPVRDVLYLRSGLGTPQTLRVLDALGRCLATVTFTTTTTLDVSQWPSGLYCVVGSGSTRRVLVAH